MVAVEVKGKLEPVIADEDFNVVMTVLNNSSQQGKNFAMMDKPDGTKMLVNIPNITTIDEIED